MNKQDSPQRLLSVVVVVIGLYMIFGFYGGTIVTPPVLSGIALVLLGVRPLVK